MFPIRLSPSLLLNLTLLFVLLQTYTSAAHRLPTSEPIRCPCSVVIKARLNAPIFRVRASPISTPTSSFAPLSDNTILARLSRLSPTKSFQTLSSKPNPTHSYRYVRAQIAQHGIFRLSVQPRFPRKQFSPTFYSILTRSTQNESCPILLPQDPPTRFETLLSSSFHKTPQTLQSSVINAVQRSEQIDSRVRIVGGRQASSTISKYTVLIQIHENSWKVSCSGTLVNPFTIITAAHCKVTNQSIVYFGFEDKIKNRGVKLEIANVKSHSRFDYVPRQGLSSYDLSYIVLKQRAPSDAKFMKINWNPSIPLDGSIVRTAGYGRIEQDGSLPQPLHQVDLHALSSIDCYHLYHTKQRSYIETDKVFCARLITGSECSPCQADSGGPVWQYNEFGEPVLLGITSRGDNCSTKVLPTLFVRTSSSFLFLPPELRWTNKTKAYILKENEPHPLVTIGPSPSFAPKPDREPPGSVESNSSGSGTRTPTITIIFGSTAGILLAGAMITVIVMLIRR